MPWEDPQGYWARSPLSLVGNVKTPTLVVVGEDDHRTPASEAEQYYDRAAAARRADGAGQRARRQPRRHCRRGPSQSAAKASAILAWFDRYRLRTAATARLGQQHGGARYPLTGLNLFTVWPS